jgi:hypothetical protein
MSFSRKCQDCLGESKKVYRHANSIFVSLGIAYIHAEYNFIVAKSSLHTRKCTKTGTTERINPILSQNINDGILELWDLYHTSFLHARWWS